MLIKKTRKKTSFVPRAVFRVALTGAGVVPLCATAGLASLAPGCGNSESLSVAACVFTDAGCATVAANCFGDAANKPPFCSGVADATFSDVKPDHDGGSVFEARGVADIGFTDVKPDQEAGGHMGVADTGFVNPG